MSTNVFKCFIFLSCSFLVLSYGYAKEAIDFETLDRHVYFGQAYPSGNVYVRRFVKMSKATSDWPKEIHLAPIAGGVDLPHVGQARFVRMMKSEAEDHTVKSVYIPGNEGMHEGHDFCGKGEIKKEDPSYKKRSKDFFEAILDHCEPNDGIAVYQIAPSNYSFMVIGADEYLSLSDPKPIDETKRPLTSAEIQTVNHEKQESKRNAGAGECTTESSFLDSAVQIFEATIKGQDATLRLSTYDNPGCAGHLSSIYVLDILRGSELLKSFNIDQYQGAL